LTLGTPLFASANAGTNIGINFSPAFSISGGDAANYSLVQPTGVTASITASKVTSVTITNAPASFSYKASGKGNTLTLTASVLPANAANKTLKWTSSDATIATVNSAGLVTFKNKEGSVTIKAEAADGSGKSASKTIKVSRNVKVSSPVTTVYLKKGKSLTLPVAVYDSSAPKKTVTSKLTWKSSKSSVAKVTQKGKITAKKKGKATITVTAHNGKKATIKIVVVTKTAKVTKLTVTAPKSIKVGKTALLKVKTGKATGAKVTFKSSKKSVLKVDKAGRLIALKKGKATITIKAGGKSVKKKITVK
ncbi:MAG: Ig-like domain-containing protein, partial [Clostridiales Family XIII bacterium]|jgi:uncharacterized protein YjdB|nr:Ig-like domain-containing protein [Clostridiales Family XIII bacterium]